MNFIKKALIILTIGTINTTHTKLKSFTLNDQIGKAIQLLQENIDPNDFVLRLFTSNIGKTIFTPVINAATGESQANLDTTLQLGFYFEKRSRFDYGEFVLVILPNHHITLGLIVGHLLETGNLEITPLPAKINKQDPIRKYILIIDKQGTWQEFQGSKLGKILPDSRRWLIKELLKKTKP